MGICSHHTNGVPILRQVLTIPPLGTNTCRKYLRTRRIGTNEVSFLGHSTGAPKGGSKGTYGTLSRSSRTVSMRYPFGEKPPTDGVPQVPAVGTFGMEPPLGASIPYHTPSQIP